MDRLDHTEMEAAEGQWSFQIQGTTWAKRARGEPVNSLRAGLCGFLCSPWHLQALTLCMACNSHPKLLTVR